MANDLINLFRKRWPEAGLVIAFQAFGLYVLELLNSSIKPVRDGSPGEFASDLSDNTIFLYAMASMAFVVLWLTLYLGFLATVCIKFDAPQEPATLIKVGRRFFWRMIRFQILFGLYCFVLYTILINVIRSFFLPGVEPGQEPPWTYLLCQLLPIIMLVRFVLVPAIMIIQNRMVFPAIGSLRQYKILKAKPVLFFVAVGIAFNVLMFLITKYVDKEAIIFNVFIAAKSLLSGLITLLVGLSTIWFVGGGKFGSYHPDTEESSEQI